MSDCNNRNLLLRAGVSQQQRVLAALVPSYAQIDERNSADLILFAKEYARYLNYYNDTVGTGHGEVTENDGDWTAFMKMDVSVTLATLAKMDSKKSFAYFDFLINTILQTGNANLADIKKYYQAIFEYLYSLVYLLDEEWQHLPKDFPFTEMCGNMIQSRMNELFWRVQQYYQQSSAINLVGIKPPFIPDNAPIDITSIQALLIQPLSSIWDFTPSSPFVLPVEGSSEAEKIKYIAQHSIFKGTIELFIKSVASLTQKASDALESSFQSYPKHAPHYALYLAFIKLFRFAQTHLNDYTGNHLNFYYKDILRLKNAPAKPDSVHLVMELAKPTQTHLLAKDTVFKAGKDVDGKEIFYAATNDVVLNKGQVKIISSVFRKNETISGVEHLKLYSAPVTNSGDGKGGDLTSADKSWKPFGDPKKNDLARTGFALAHSMLFMKEGTRTITVTFECINVTSLTTSAAAIKNWFLVRVTGPKDWIDLTVTNSQVLTSEKKLVLTIAVSDDKPAIVPYNEKTHAAGYSTALPVMEFTVNTNSFGHDPHLFLDILQVKKVKLAIDVKGLKDVSIQNELSALDSAKPFDIFGPQPHIGSSFIIGSKEIFLKNSDASVQATLHFEWDKVDKLKSESNDWPNFVDKKVRVKFLQNGVWNTVNVSPDQTIFNHVHHNVDGIFYHVSLAEPVYLFLGEFDNTFDFTANTPYTINSRSGFMKIEFLGPIDFGHGDFIKRFTSASLNKTTLPDQPYTPSVKSLTIDYTAEAYVHFLGTNASDDKGHFFHLLPFGHAEKHGSTVNLLPNFTFEGRMYIGLEQFKADESIQILFQLSEGSANPLKDRQNVEWAYLSKYNTWINFDDKSVSDSTNDLTQTGIIKFGFPHNATDINSTFSEKLFWIRGAVAKDTDAICNIIQLFAQAIKAKFADHLSNGNYYKNILPESTISKLVVSDQAIKKTQQPYTSFGGRVIESDADFHVRVSERLRHKNRGITMWDYEHLVLQNFPEIYKVKCINHAKITLSGSVESDNEMSPGHVIVVPVPDLRNKNAIDPLKPMTGIGVLTNINEFLKKHISPFVQLQVKNARFEEIQLDFRVKFNNDDGAFYHDVLRDEIVEFLSPWAFDTGADLSFGGSVYKSVLLNFVEERPYVDFVTCFKMFHWVDGIKSSDVDEAVATSAISVLVSYGGSATSDKHIIDFVNHDCNC
jgi:hypothetical protein